MCFPHWGFVTFSQSPGEFILVAKGIYARRRYFHFFEIFIYFVSIFFGGEHEN